MAQAPVIMKTIVPPKTATAFVKLAKANDRSIAAEMRVALEAHLRLNEKAA